MKPENERVKSVEATMRMIVLQLLVFWAETGEEKFNDAADLMARAVEVLNGSNNRKGEGVRRDESEGDAPTGVEER